MEIPKHFTLKQVADSIQKTISERYARTYWVTAEMYKLNATPKGHCYPELVQKENDKIVVEMRGTLWKTNYDRIRQRFFEIVKEPLQDGLELLFLVKITYHPIYNIGLEIIDIDPNYSLGALQRERQISLEKLSKEGLISKNQEQFLPLVPKRLAVISQANSKGYSDFISLLNGHPRFHIDTFLFEAILQGDAAILSIQGQLKQIEKVKHHFDAVVIIRGGGGEIGMHCYNNYELAKAIATFPLPVFTGIGHSTNLTVCEMVAYRNGITPSDMAYFFLGIYEALDAELEKIQHYFPQLVESKLAKHQQEFKTGIHRFRQSVNFQQSRLHNRFTQSLHQFVAMTNRYIAKTKNEINEQRNVLRPLIINRISALKNKQSNAQNLIQIHTRGILNSRHRSVSEQQGKLHSSVQGKLLHERVHLTQLEKTMTLLDPKVILKRGYALVSNKDGVIGAGNTIKVGEELIIQTAKQELDVEVKKARTNK